MRYTAEPLATALTEAGRAVALVDSRARLGIADLSAPGGGKIPQHRSHQSGRDADILFLQRRGRHVLDATTMERFAVSHGADDAKAQTARAASGAEFDVALNWAFVEALLTSRAVEVEWVFIAEPLAQLLLDYAMQQRRPDYLVATARSVLRQPGDSAPHDDHIHIRIRCQEREARAGCEDPGMRKKTPRAIVVPPITLLPWLLRATTVPPRPNA